MNEKAKEIKIDEEENLNLGVRKTNSKLKFMEIPSMIINDELSF